MRRNKLIYIAIQNLNLVNQAEAETHKDSSKTSKTILRQIDNNSKSNSPIKLVFSALLIVLAGTVTGFGLTKAVGKSSNSVGSSTITPEQAAQNGLKAGDVFGSQDKETFRDSAEGVLVKGGVEGEGSHHLLRPGGVDQNVYLTSSTMDLDQFVDHKVSVRGETFAAQKAGWLMDVGRLEVIELNAEKPADLK